MSIEEIQQHKELFETADAVIFSAWTVNFNQPLSFFESQVRALSALSTVLVSCKSSPRLFFISSISSSSENHASDSNGIIVPEGVLPNGSDSMPMGYAQSKYVAERVLAKFAQHTGLNVTILRLGQIAGPVTDISTGEKSSSAKWNEREWFPSVMKSSAHLGAIPSDLEPADWIPVNLMTRGIAELISHDVLGKATSTLQVYNVVNPSQVSWSELVPTIQEILPSKCTIVPFATWIKDLRSKEAEPQAGEKYPALKILDYLEATLSVSGRSKKIVVDNIKEASTTFAELRPVNKEWVQQWLSSWDLTTS